MTYLRNLAQWTLILSSAHFLLGCGNQGTGECLTVDALAKAFIHDSQSLVESARLFKSPRINPIWQEDKQENIQPDKVFTIAETMYCRRETYDHLLLVKMKNGNSILLAGPPQNATLDASLQSAMARTADLYGINYFKDDFDDAQTNTTHRYFYNKSDYANDHNIDYSAVKIDFTGNNKEDIKISICPNDTSGNFSIQGC